MVQLAHKQSPLTTNRVASALKSRNRVGSGFDGQLTPPEVASKQRLANKLASELWARLPISRVAQATGHRGIEHVIRIATASSSQVSTWYQELQDFVTAIVQTATEFRGDTAPDAVRAELRANIQRQILEQVRFPLPNRSFVDFEFADLPPEVAMAKAHQHLERACLEFVNQFFVLFDPLQQLEVVGSIQRTSSTCRFTFFRRVAILKESQKRTRRQTRRDPDFQIPGHCVSLFETFQLSNFEVQHRHAQFAHHVRNPVLNEPKATKYPLPTKYRRLIDCCPDWMAGFLKILEGQLFREERIEWHLSTETRAVEQLIERVRLCPAIVFGPYILAGWGELAIAQEENRQRDKHHDAVKKTFAKKSRVNRLLSFLVAGLAIAVIPFTGSATTATTSLAILLGLVAMALAGNAAHLASVARGRLSAGRVLLHSTVVGAAVFAVQGLLFSILHWSLPAFGMAILAGAIAVVAFSMKNANKELDGFSVG